MATEVAFEGEAVSGTAELLDISIAEILHPDVGADSGLGQNFLGTGQADAIHIGESDLDPLIARDIDAGNPSHVGKRFKVNNWNLKPVPRVGAGGSCSQAERLGLISPGAACAWGWCRSP